MMNRVLLIAIALGVTACAANDVATTSMVDNVVTQTDTTAPMMSSTSGQTAVAPEVSRRSVASGDVPNVGTPSNEVATAPTDQSAPPANAPQAVGYLSMENVVAYERDDIVCRKVRRTGSNLFRKVCESRAAIEERAERDKDVLRQMVLIR